MLDVKFEIKYKNRISKVISCKLPDKYQDLEPDDLLLLCTNIEKGYTVTEFKMLLFKKYSGLTSKDISQLYREKFALSELLDEMNIDLFSLQCDKNLLPHFEFEGVKYFGPVGDLTDLSFDQFTFAEDLFNMYHDTKEETFLHLMIECLYHAEGKVCDLNKIDRHKPLFKNLDKNLCLAVTLSYRAMCRQLFSNFPNIFPKVDKQEQELVNKSGYDYTMFNRMRYDLAKGDLSKQPVIGNESIPKVLIFLSCIKDEPTATL